MRGTFAAALLTWLVWPVAISQAHFIWLWTEPTGQRPHEVRVKAFFSEGLEPDSKAYINGITQNKTWVRTAQGLKPRPLGTVTEGELGWLQGLAENVEGSYAVEMVCPYGVFSRGDKSMLLHYYAKTLWGTPADWPTVARSEELKLDIVPSVADGQLNLLVVWNGKPVADAQVMVAKHGEKEQELKTNDEGKTQVKLGDAGWYTCRTRILLPDASGEDKGKKYQETRHYSTLTFQLAAADKTAPKNSANTLKSAPETNVAKTVESPFPAMPDAVTSFGAAVADDWLYVYSGHTGTAHAHSKKNLSLSFARLNLKQPKAWEKLPMETPLQGLAMVAHGGKIYRIGGLDARNEPEAESDLHSVAEFASFDPATKKWSPLPQLPQPRSSHDAVVVDDKIYVAGGWNLKGGSSNAVWFEDVLVYDLKAEQHAWKELCQAPFQRRALATAAMNGKLYVLGGIDVGGQLSQRVDVLDLASQKWSTGPELPVGENKGNGFGISAWATPEGLFAAGMDGHLYELQSDPAAWKSVLKLQTPRFFHRLLPADTHRLLAIGGAGWGTGHLDSIELLTLPTSK